MKNFLFIGCCLLLTANCFAQAGMWTWMKGDTTIGSAGSFGTKGVTSASNEPPSMYEACEWKDHQGNFWMFGGFYNTLWKFEPSTNNWTWIKGSSVYNDPGSYGTQGVPSSTNNPPARGMGVATWVDLNGDLWLFGGSGSGSYSDLWRYQIATNEWTWMKGPNTVGQPGNYGTQGQTSPSNYPKSRWECNASWVDTAGNLWLFGGYSSGNLNDLWKFEITTNNWTWMKGSNSVNPFAVYGIKGVEDVANVPGGRHIYSKWRDADGNFWLFGGMDYGVSFETYNDMWKYNVSTNNWSWMAGTNNLGDDGYYGFSCIASAAKAPAGRYENRAAWTDSCGKFWLFGGRKDYNGAGLSDLWKFDPATNEFTLVYGDSLTNKPGFFGTQTIPNSNNHPSSNLGSVSWIDGDGNLWVFGGCAWWGSGNLNVLWRFTPDTSCGMCVTTSNNPSQFSSSDTTICQKFCTDFFDQSTNNPTSWQWNFPGGVPSSSTDQNPTNICYNNPGTYDVTLITTNLNGSDTLTLSNYITVYSTPAFPTITQNGYTLTSSPAASYQWQLNSADIPGATNQSYTITQTGYYTVIVGDSNGCVNSATQYVLIEGIGESADDNAIAIYPNPSSGDFMVEWLDGFMAGEISIDVVNTLGQKVFSSEEIITPSSSKEISLQNISAGIYFLEIKSESIFVKKKIIINK